jgi:hypothetical protein
MVKEVKSKSINKAINIEFFSKNAILQKFLTVFIVLIF